MCSRERERKVETRKMSRVLEFLAQTTLNSIWRCISEHFLNKEDISKATFTELPNDPESVLIDPHITTAIHSIVESIQSRKCATHFLFNLNTYRSHRGFEIPPFESEKCQNQIPEVRSETPEFMRTVKLCDFSSISYWVSLILISYFIY